MGLSGVGVAMRAAPTVRGVTISSFNSNKGQVVYRVWGDGASPWGQSWTPVNPKDVSNYRSVAGLPDVNAGRFVTEGVLECNEGVIVREAQIIKAGQQGGLTEYVIPNAMDKIRVLRVSGVNPEF